MSMTTRHTQVAAATQAQQQATDPTQHVWVGANAGSGKTHVLVGRVIALLVTDPTLRPDEILAVTYTKMGAREMRNRIARDVQRLAKQPVADQQAALTQLLSREPTPAELARVAVLPELVLDYPVTCRTIHSFSQTVLARFPVEAGLPPAFTVLEAAAAKRLLQQAQEKLFAQFYQAETAGETAWAWQRLSVELAETTLREALQVFALNNRSLSQVLNRAGGEQNLLQDLALNLDLPADLAPGDEVVAATAWEPSAEVAKQLQAAVPILQQGGKNAQDRAAALTQFFTKNHSNSRKKVYFSLFFNKSGENTKNLLEKKLAEQNPELTTLLYEEQARLAQLLARQNAHDTWLNTAAFVTLGGKFIDIYQSLKQDQAALDYDDLIYHTAQLLADDSRSAWVRYRLDTKVRHVLLDEGQDTNADQWSILAALTAEFLSGTGQDERVRTLFAVGDVKQSIFRFSGAKPHVFQEVWTQHLAPHVATKQARQVQLSTSFRTSEAVLQVVDQVCAMPACQKLLGEQAVEHISARPQQGGIVELWPPVKVDKTEREAWSLPQQSPTDTAQRVVINQVVSRIQSLLSGTETLLEQPAQGEAYQRAIDAADILILTRSNKWLRPLQEALQKVGIPVATNSSNYAADHPVIADLLALGQLLDHPEDDQKLVHVLRSPWVGWTDEQVFELAQQPRPWAQQLPEKERHWLHDLLAKRQSTGAYEVFVAALARLNFRGSAAHRLALGGSAASVNAPIDAFLAAALACEDLTLLIQQVMQEGVSATAGVDAAQAVRLMTVHGAKGLEAPIVFMPDTADPYDAQYGKEKLVWQLDEAQQEQGVMYRTRAAQASSYQAQLDEAEKERLQADELRLLYVALTRAKDRLYISGIEKKDEELKTWYGLLNHVAEQNNWPQVAGAYVWQLTADAYPKQEQEITEAAPIVLPGWWNVPMALAQPATVAVTASKAVAESSQFALTRGQVIHRLLQWLPTLPAAEQASHGAAFIQHHAPQLNSQTERILSQVMAVWQQHPQLFTSTSLAEVPVYAALAVGELHGVIDRLVVTDTTVTIVDYKTDALAPQDVPAAYVEQLRRYAAAIGQIMPEKQVETAIMWLAAVDDQGRPLPRLQAVKIDPQLDKQAGSVSLSG